MPAGDGRKWGLGQAVCLEGPLLQAVDPSRDALGIGPRPVYESLSFNLSTSPKSLVRRDPAPGPVLGCLPSRGSAARSRCHLTWGRPLLWCSGLVGSLLFRDQRHLEKCPGWSRGSGPYWHCLQQQTLGYSPAPTSSLRLAQPTGCPAWTPRAHSVALGTCPSPAYHPAGAPSTSLLPCSGP